MVSKRLLDPGVSNNTNSIRDVLFSSSASASIGRRPGRQALCVQHLQPCDLGADELVDDDPKRVPRDAGDGARGIPLRASEQLPDKPAVRLPVQSSAALGAKMRPGGLVRFCI